MPTRNHLTDGLFTLLLILFLAAAAWIIQPIAARAATPEPDRIATGVAEAKATGVAEAKAIAATLTADASEEDRFATRVADAVAATLTAVGPPPAQTCVPAAAPVATATPVSAANYGATQHCMAKAGYATIELRNIVTKEKSLDLFIDGVRTITLNYGKYGCIYLNDGKYVFQWKSSISQKQSNARSFTVSGSDGWYSGSKRADGIRNPYDAWLDVYKPKNTAIPVPTSIPSPTHIP